MAAVFVSPIARYVSMFHTMLTGRSVAANRRSSRRARLRVSTQAPHTLTLVRFPLQHERSPVERIPPQLGLAERDLSLA